MPAKRTHHISPRDVEVLDFIARFGVVPRTAVATWANTGRSVTVARERRLREDGLLRTERGYGPLGPLVICTKLGLKASGRRELPAARLSLAALSHETVVATVAAELERTGEAVLSEREILAREKAAGERILSSALPGGRSHRPDLVRLDADGAPLEAIEVELSCKGASRMDELLRAWRRAILERRFAAVSYVCAPRTLPFVRRAVERTKTGGLIEVREL